MAWFSSLLGNSEEEEEEEEEKEEGGTGVGRPPVGSGGRKLVWLPLLLPCGGGCPYAISLTFC